jgi:hypothetical protein
MILDWEEHEAVRVFLEQWLVRFLRLDGRSHDWLLCLWLLDTKLGCLVDLSSGLLQVFLASSTEAQLLHWAIHHLESLNARRGLR